MAQQETSQIAKDLQGLKDQVKELAKGVTSLSNTIGHTVHKEVQQAWQGLAGNPKGNLNGSNNSAAAGTTSGPTVAEHLDSGETAKLRQSIDSMREQSAATNGAIRTLIGEIKTLVTENAKEQTAATNTGTSVRALTSEIKALSVRIENSGDDTALEALAKKVTALEASSSQLHSFLKGGPTGFAGTMT